MSLFGRRFVVCAVPVASLLGLFGCGGGGGGGDADGESDNTAVTTTGGAPQSTIPESTTTTTGVPCICIFDIDRTLTGRQGDMEKCPNNAEQKGVFDDAYQDGRPGDLTLIFSEALQGIDETFCGSCYLATLSAGGATGGGVDGKTEQKALYAQLSKMDSMGALEEKWGTGCDFKGSPLMTKCTDGQKQTAVPHILDYYKKTQGVEIATDEVYFFDDRVSNVAPFKGLEQKYNARQISCPTRDETHNKEIGWCGAEIKELERKKGVHLCDDSSDETVV